MGLEMLEAEAGPAGGVDLDHPRDAERVGIVRTGLRLRAARGACRQQRRNENRADRTHAEATEQVIAKIRAEGMPTYYGPQRFGRGGETADLGFKVLNGQQRQRLRPFLFKFALSAAQSVLFNRVLANRQRDGLLRTVLQGDVMMKWPFGGMFVAEDVVREQQRLDAREIVSAGPIVGRKTFAAKDDAAAREAAALAALELAPAQFAAFGKLMQGTRRHNLVYVDDLAYAETQLGLCFTFTLPAGSYATVLLREIMKKDFQNPFDDEGVACE